MTDQTTYPRIDGDVTVLGPEIFASKGGAVICWKGDNYVRQYDIEPSRDEMTAGALHELASGVRDLCSAIRLENAEREPDADREQAEAWRRKAVRRALKISKLQGTLAAVTDLASEQITARTEWGDGYRAALADLQEVLREFEPPAPDPEVVEPATITDPAWLREQYVGAMLDVIEPFRALVKPEAIRIADELATAVMGIRDRHLDQLRQRLQLADELPTLDGQPPAPDAGPTVREAADHDRAHWGQRQWGGE